MRTKLQKQQWEFVKDVSVLIQKIHLLGLLGTFGEAFRTVDQQRIYMETGKSQTMNSRHLVRLAIDINIFRQDLSPASFDDIKEIGDFWESLSPQNRAGMFWKFQDNFHFERMINNEHDEDNSNI